MTTAVPATKKRRIEKINLFNNLSEHTIAFAFSFLDLLDLIKSVCIVNKEFNHCIEDACTFLWRQYCQSHNISTTTWILSAKNDIKSNIIIQKLLHWKFPTLKENRCAMKSKYINQIINDGLIECKQINDTLYEYESIDLIRHLSKNVKCDKREIHIIDSFIVNQFDKLRSLGNIEPITRQREDIWIEYKKRGDIYWKNICGDIHTVKQWLHGALLPGDFEYNLYCINNRYGRGKYGKTDEEKKEDKLYVKSAEKFIELFVDTFCRNEMDTYRFYVAGHVGSEMLDLD
eukprot:255501_1